MAFIDVDFGEVVRRVLRSNEVSAGKEESARIYTHLTTV